MTSKPRLAFVLGIRPDVIRASLILEHLRNYGDIEVTFIWSGQHYSDNLKSIFFRELNVAPAEIDLRCTGDTDAAIVGSVVSRLYPVLERLRPAAVVFLGDTNTTTGALAAAQLNIPIVHIEGCMRSYDWRMPEEKYRTVIDHLSDVIYAYLEEYKEQGVREGLNGANIVVVGNPIVDVLHRYYFDRQATFDAMATPEFFASRGLERGEYYLMTCHRRENVGADTPFRAILDLVRASPFPVFFPASYRTQAAMREYGLTPPGNVRLVDPIGYEEMLCLLVHARATITDSGTVVEEACVLQVPSVQMRRSTERPQVYDVGSSVKFDPSAPQGYPAADVFRKLESLAGKRWEHTLGDGRSSERIAQDLHRRIVEQGFGRHQPEQYHIPVARSFREDGVDGADVA
jgi:UDP-N-acetylglucosamine 2-epimerase (non-hydrolysing)